jgi:hypothetical protein
VPVPFVITASQILDNRESINKNTVGIYQAYDWGANP